MGNVMIATNKKLQTLPKLISSQRTKLKLCSTRLHDPSELKTKVLTSLLIANLSITLPASADAGKIFDFNATLPVMAAQFLLLMVFLDKVWFGPVGKVMNERNSKIAASRESLATGTGELEALQNQAEALLKEARIEAKANIADAKAALNAKAESELAAEKSRLDREIELAVKELSNQKTSAQSEIDTQVAELSQYIIKRVLPAGYKL